MSYKVNESCRSWLIAMLFVLAVGALTPARSLAQAQDAAKTVTLDRKSVAEATEINANKYKTREGRLAAKPLDWNSTIGKRTSMAEEPGATERLKYEKPSAIEGGKPNPNAKRDAERLHPEDWRRSLAKPAPAPTSWLNDHQLQGKFIRVAGSPDIFTQYCENCPSINVDAPYVRIGKLFSNAGTCTASVISGNSVIVTAAHCCYDRVANNWIGGWTFAPGYNNGNAPFGTFSWSSATVLTSWVNNGDIPSDVCLIHLANDAAGRGVAYYTGWLGRSWDWGSDQDHHALGYPGNLGNANVLELCTSESFSPSGSCGGSGVLNTGCSMTYGSSGGPWIRSYRGSDWVNSVVHGYDSQSCTGTFGQTFNGARFTSGNIVPLCNAAGC